MNFEQDYNRIVQFAENQIKMRKLGGLDPHDLVNDAYIDYINSGKAYSFELIKGSIVNQGWLSFNQQKDHAPIDALYSEEKTDVITYSYCKKCNETLPISAFYVNQDKKKNRTIISTLCKTHTCEQKRARHIPAPPKEPKPKKKHKPSPANRKRKRKLSTRIKKTAEEKRLAWNAYMRKRREKQKSDKPTKTKIHERG